MFTITIYSLTYKNDNLTRNVDAYFLFEAECHALGISIQVLGCESPELVYIEDLDYYVYEDGERIARLTIKPLYVKEETKK